MAHACKRWCEAELLFRAYLVLPPLVTLRAHKPPMHSANARNRFLLHSRCCFSHVLTGTACAQATLALAAAAALDTTPRVLSHSDCMHDLESSLTTILLLFQPPMTASHAPGKMTMGFLAPSHSAALAISCEAAAATSASSNSNLAAMSVVCTRCLHRKAAARALGGQQYTRSSHQRTRMEPA